MAAPRLIATYALRADARTAAARAGALALEQSVELPLAAVRDPRVRDEVVAQVLSVTPRSDGRHDVRLALAHETFGRDAGQLLNMLFGNSSLHDDVELHDVELSREASCGVSAGRRFGIAGVARAATGAAGRPLTCAALKPLGQPPAALAALAGTLARGGIDVIKDDHGLADQAERAVLRARPPRSRSPSYAANRATGGRTVYAPSVTGDLDAMHAQLFIARQRAGRRCDPRRADGERRLVAGARLRRDCRRADPRASVAGQAPRGSRRRCCSASCSGCSAPMRRSSRMRAAASDTRLRPATPSCARFVIRGRGSRPRCRCPRAACASRASPRCARRSATTRCC